MPGTSVDDCNSVSFNRFALMRVIVLLVFHWSEVIVCLSYDVRATDTTYHWVISSLGPLLRMKRNVVLT